MFSPDISRAYPVPGEQGKDVEQLQLKLLRLGYYNGPIHKTYDNGTQEAVTLFQSTFNLQADGIARPETLQAIDFALGRIGSFSEPTPPEPVQSKTRVTQRDDDDVSAGSFFVLLLLVAGFLSSITKPEIKPEKKTEPMKCCGCKKYKCCCE